MLLTLSIIAALILVYIIGECICRIPISAEKKAKWIKEERELGRELYMKEMIERGYTTNFKTWWIFTLQMGIILPIKCVIMDNKRILLIILAMIIAFAIGMYF